MRFWNEAQQVETPSTELKKKKIAYSYAEIFSSADS